MLCALQQPAGFVTLMREWRMVRKTIPDCKSNHSVAGLLTTYLRVRYRHLPGDTLARDAARSGTCKLLRTAKTAKRWHSVALKTSYSVPACEGRVNVQEWGCHWSQKWDHRLPRYRDYRARTKVQKQHGRRVQRTENEAHREHRKELTAIIDCHGSHSGVVAGLKGHRKELTAVIDCHGSHSGMVAGLQGHRKELTVIIDCHRTERRENA